MLAPLEVLRALGDVLGLRFLLVHHRGRRQAGEIDSFLLLRFRHKFSLLGKMWFLNTKYCIQRPSNTLPGASLGGPLGPMKVVSLKNCFLRCMILSWWSSFLSCSLVTLGGVPKSVFIYSHGFCAVGEGVFLSGFLFFFGAGSNLIYFFGVFLLVVGPLEYFFNSVEFWQN